MLLFEAQGLYGQERNLFILGTMGHFADDALYQDPRTPYYSNIEATEHFRDSLTFYPTYGNIFVRYSRKLGTRFPKNIELSSGLEFSKIKTRYQVESEVFFGSKPRDIERSWRRLSLLFDLSIMYKVDSWRIGAAYRQSIVERHTFHFEPRTHRSSISHHWRWIGQRSPYAPAYLALKMSCDVMKWKDRTLGVEVSVGDVIVSNGNGFTMFSLGGSYSL